MTSGDGGSYTLSLCVKIPESDTSSRPTQFGELDSSHNTVSPRLGVTYTYYAHHTYSDGPSHTLTVTLISTGGGTQVPAGPMPIDSVSLMRRNTPATAVRTGIGLHSPIRHECCDGGPPLLAALDLSWDE